jgi:hypothetical protein
MGYGPPRQPSAARGGAGDAIVPRRAVAFAGCIGYIDRMTDIGPPILMMMFSVLMITLASGAPQRWPRIRWPLFIFALGLFVPVALRLAGLAELRLPMPQWLYRTMDLATVAMVALSLIVYLRFFLRKTGANGIADPR